MKKNLFKTLTTCAAIVLFATQAIAQANLNGKVLYHLNNNKPIPSVNMSLVDTAGVVVATSVSNMSGNYSFTNVPYGTYTLTASTSISAGGITMGDAFLMFLNLLGIYPFNPIQQLAADVDGDGSVTWNDYWTVVIGWFVQGYPFPTGPWVFQEMQLSITGTKTNLPTMGGSSSGDVNGTFVPSTREIAAVNANYIPEYSGENFTVAIYANEITEADAMGMVINYPAELASISDVQCQLGECNMIVNNGQIRMSWVNQSNNSVAVDPSVPVITIKGSRIADLTTDIRFVINPESHFCNYKGDRIETSFTLPIITSTGSILGANYPNPFRNQTTINFSLPAESKVNISLYNQQGQLVKVIADGFENAGNHSINFESNGLEPGIFYYTLKTMGSSAVNETKKMIITR